MADIVSEMALDEKEPDSSAVGAFVRRPTFDWINFSP